MTIWHNTEITDQLLPMPTYCLNNKQYLAKEYGALITISNFNYKLSEKHRYVYKNKFNIEELAKDLGIGRTTLIRNIKKLHKCGAKVLNIMNTQEGICYTLDYAKLNKQGNDLNKYVRIPQCMLKTLVCAFNTNAIKVYCLFKYMCSETDFKNMDNKWIAEQVGLSSNSKNNLDTITEITKQLELCGFIENRKTNIFKFDKNKCREVPQLKKSYRIRTLEEWKTIQGKVKHTA